MLRPRAAPLTALAAQLAKLLAGQGIQATRDALALDARTLHLSVELALADRPADERVIVIVDQFEEVFTLRRDETERRQLFGTLLPNGRARLRARWTCAGWRPSTGTAQRTRLTGHQRPRTIAGSVAQRGERK